VAFVASIILAGYAFNKKTGSNLSRTFSLQVFAMAGLCLVNFLFLVSKTSESAVLWGRLLMALASFIPAMWLRLALILTGKGSALKKTFLVYLFPLPFALLGITTNLFIADAYITFWGYGFTTGNLYILWEASMIIISLISFYILYKFYLKTESKKEKTQTKLFILAMVIPFFPTLMIDIVPYLKFESLSLIAVCILIYITINTYSIIKYGLMTITSKMAGDKIIETMTDYLVVADEEGKIFLVNDSFLKLVGQEKEELAGKPLSVLLNEAEKLLAELKNKDLVENYETEILTAEKKSTLMSVNASKIKGKFGDTVGFVIVLRDIGPTKELIGNLNEKIEIIKKSNTEMKDTSKAMLNLLEDARELEKELKVEKTRVEKKVVERTKELKEEHVRLQSSINSLSIGFFMIDLNLEITMINPIAKRILCFTKDHDHSAAITDKNVQMQCKMKDIEEGLRGIFDFQAELGRSIAEKRPIEIKNLEFNGRFLRIFISPIVEVEELKIKVIGAVALIEDVTEARALERARDEFFSIASHELRTPLTAIRGNTSLIEQMYMDQIKDKDFKEMIDDIHESSQRLIEIVNDFLNMSRLELGKIQFNNQPIDLVQIIDDVIREYQTTGSIKMLYLRFSHPEKTVQKVFADKDRVKEILINLIGNAIKFTEKGGITLDLIVEDNKTIKVTIADTGEGISEEGQDRLFKKFQQAAGSIYTRDSTRGTGLGLYISRLMMEGMKGHIGLEKSVLGKGSIFYFDLPTATEEQIKSSAGAAVINPIAPMTRTKLRMSQGKI